MKVFLVLKPQKAQKREVKVESALWDILKWDWLFFSQRAHRVVREEDDDEKEGENGTRKTGTIRWIYPWRPILVLTNYVLLVGSLKPDRPVVFPICYLHTLLSVYFTLWALDSQQFHLPCQSLFSSSRCARVVSHRLPHDSAPTPILNQPLNRDLEP
jgi:hypothetical protein